MDGASHPIFPKWSQRPAAMRAGSLHIPPVGKVPAVYILANKPHGVLYIGVTSNLAGRVYLHKGKVTRGFTAKYNVDRLVYYELFDDMYTAISREKQLKAGSRRKKIELIESLNPRWADLYDSIYGW